MPKGFPVGIMGESGFSDVQVGNPEANEIGTPTHKIIRGLKQFESMPGVDESLQRQLNFETKAHQTIRQAEVGPADKVFVVHSMPVPCEEGGSKIDLLVIDPNEHKALDRFKRQLEMAQEAKLAGETYVNKEILPGLANVKGVVAVSGFGDIFDPCRVPDENSSIDLMIFIEGTEEDVGENIAVKFQRIEENIVELAKDHKEAEFSVRKVIKKRVLPY